MELSILCDYEFLHQKISHLKYPCYDYRFLKLHIKPRAFMRFQVPPSLMLLLSTPFHTSFHPKSKLTNIFICKHNNPTFLFAFIFHMFASFSSSLSLPRRTMNVYEEQNPYCYFHPKELIVGICALCLKERLLILASKQGHHPVHKEATHRPHKALHRKPSIPIPKVFALGSFLHRLEFRHQKSNNSDQDAFTSLEGNRHHHHLYPITNKREFIVLTWLHFSVHSLTSLVNMLHLCILWCSSLMRINASYMVTCCFSFP